MTRKVGSRDKKKRKSRIGKIIVGGSLIGLAAGSVYLLSRNTPTQFPGLEKTQNLLSGGRSVNLTRKTIIDSEKKRNRTRDIFNYLKSKGIVDSVNDPTPSFKERGFRIRMNMVKEVREKYNEIMQQFYKKRKEKIASIRSLPSRRKYENSTKYYRPDIKLDQRMSTTKLIKSAKDIPGILPTRTDRKNTIGFSRHV